MERMEMKHLIRSTLSFGALLVLPQHNALRKQGAACLDVHHHHLAVRVLVAEMGERLRGVAAVAGDVAVVVVVLGVTRCCWPPGFEIMHHGLGGTARRENAAEKDHLIPACPF